VWRLVDAAERDGGALTVNWHDRSLAPERQWGDFYVELVGELKGRGAWFPTASRAAAWFAQRRSVAFGAVDWERGSARIRISANTSQDLPGLTIRVHAPGTSDDIAPARRRQPRRFTDVTLVHARDMRVAFDAA
ncbi:MAG TPA: hypothetical protein VMS64_13880, partial [Candidatus Methylomirabilis sp.]|nr:hypothetical protein [Candidatus Methylomirabilis sp.]